MGSVLNLINEKYGRLLVIKRVENSKDGESQWLCLCDCGNEKICVGKRLKSGKVSSCGCLHKEIISKITTERNKLKHNTYELFEFYGIGYTFNNSKFYFDLEDYNLIKNYCWHKINNKYLATKIEDGLVILMHRLIMNCPDNLQVDHVNHDESDNRKNNLRLVTNQQNSMNNILGKNNTSGIVGVTWHKHHKKWYVQIKYNNKNIFLGLFDKIEDAKNTRINAEFKYFGEFRNMGEV